MTVREPMEGGWKDGQAPMEGGQQGQKQAELVNDVVIIFYFFMEATIPDSLVLLFQLPHDGQDYRNRDGHIRTRAEWGKQNENYTKRMKSLIEENKKLTKENHQQDWYDFA